MKMTLPLIATLFTSSLAFATSRPYLQCKVSNGNNGPFQSVTFDYPEFENSMLVAKTVTLETGFIVQLTAAYITAGEGGPEQGFLEIEITNAQSRPLASSRHNLDMNLRDVHFQVSGLAQVDCQPY